MATEVTIGGDGSLFKGEDKILRMFVRDASGNRVDITGWTIRFVVRRMEAGTATVIDKAATVIGTFNASADDQWAEVTLTDADLSFASGIYKHSWKRTDDGSETILVRGQLHEELATQT